MTAALTMIDYFTTSKSTSVEAIKLPRYRRRRSQTQESDIANTDGNSSPQHHMSNSPVSPAPTTSLTLSPNLAARPIVRILTFRRTIFFSDITIYAVNALTGTETPVYHSQTSKWNFCQPDIVFYSGGQPAPAHILAVSRFRWSHDARMGLGSNSLDDAAIDTQWEIMKNTSSWWAHFQYDFTVPSSDSHGQRRNFRWLRTHNQDDGVDGWAGYLSLRNYKLFDLDASKEVSVFLADNLRSLTKKGELRLFEPLAKNVEVAVVLSMCSISEKTTRRGRAQRNFLNPE